MTSLANGIWRHDLATIDTVAATGLRRATARRRVRTGRWTEPLPDVLCRTNGVLTTGQWRTAALLYGGETAVLSHATAAALYGLVSPPVPPLDITIPHGRARKGRTELVTVHQSIRPLVSWHVEGWSCTPVTRTVVDLALTLRAGDDVTALIGRALQRRWTSVEQLAEELERAPRRGSRNVRLALGDLAAGSHSAAERQFFRLLPRYGLPLPELNAAVRTEMGTKYVDALWRALKKGVEIDGQRFHLDAAAWQADLLRQNAIQATGVVLLRIAARRLWTEPESVLREVAHFLGVPIRGVA